MCVFASDCGSGALRAGACALVATRAAPTRKTDQRIGGPLLPVLDFEFRLQLALPVGDLELEVLRADGLLELQVRATAVVEPVRPLAREQRDELVAAELEVAEIQALHAALEQRL